MPYRDVARLAGSLLASLLLHLALVVDISELHWPQATGPATPAAPLEVRFSPLSSLKVKPAPTTQRLPPVKPTTRTQTSEEAHIPQPLPVVENIISGELTAVPPAPTFVAPPESSPAPSAEPQKTTIQRLPASGKLVYQFYWGEARWLAGRAVHEWVVEGDRYSFSSNVTTTGLFALLHPTRLVETANGLVVGGRLRPLHFSTQLNDYPPILAVFNWQKNYFHWYRNQAAFTQNLPADAYDKISFLYQLYLAEDKDRLSSAHVSTGKELEQYDIENLGRVELEIEGRIFPTLHLRKPASAANSDVIDVWLSTTHKLPIKITQSNTAGYHFEQVISVESMPSSNTDKMEPD
jgi:hypothetical protein